MWANFKIKVLISIVIMAAIVFTVKSDYAERVMPALKYVMRDSGIEIKALRVMDTYLENRFFEPLPVMNEQIPIQLPCQFSSVLRHYGWSWDPVSNQQTFYPGIRMLVLENTLVQSVAGGQVIEVEESDGQYTVTIRHDAEFFSYYGGLKEVLVEKGMNLSLVKPIGRSTSELYLELRDDKGPIDPQTVFKK